MHVNIVLRASPVIIFDTEQVFTALQQRSSHHYITHQGTWEKLPGRAQTLGSRERTLAVPVVSTTCPLG